LRERAIIVAASVPALFWVAGCTNFVLYQWGFQITLAGTALFIVVSHMN
jgi:hypothetical protein